jgi:hypothetical protein
MYLIACKIMMKDFDHQRKKIYHWLVKVKTNGQVWDCGISFSRSSSTLDRKVKHVDGLRR